MHSELKKNQKFYIVFDQKDNKMDSFAIEMLDFSKKNLEIHFSFSVWDLKIGELFSFL